MKTSGGGLVIGLFLSASLAACGGSATQAAGPTTGETTASVAVQNQSTFQMTIYAAYAGQQVRLGTVQGLQTARFEIPESIVGIGRELSFVADPFAGQGVASSFEIFVAPGEVIQLTIPPTVR